MALAVLSSTRSRLARKRAGQIVQPAAGQFGRPQPGRLVVPATSRAQVPSFTPGPGYPTRDAPRAPSAPSAPKPGGVPAGPAKPAGGVGLDSQALAAIAQLQFARNTQLSQLARQGAYASQDYHEALRRRLADRPAARQGLREDMNQQGLFFSGQLGKAQGEQESLWGREDSDARAAFERQQAERAAAAAAIEAGYSIDEAMIIAESVGRQVEQDIQDADDGLLGPPSGGGGGGGGGGRTPAPAPSLKTPIYPGAKLPTQLGGNLPRTPAEEKTVMDIWNAAAATTTRKKRPGGRARG